MLVIGIDIEINEVIWVIIDLNEEILYHKVISNE